MTDKERILEFAKLFGIKTQLYTKEKDYNCIHEEGLKMGAVEDITFLGQNNHFMVSFLFNSKGTALAYTGESVNSFVSLKDNKITNFMDALKASP